VIEFGRVPGRIWDRDHGVIRHDERYWARSADGDVILQGPEETFMCQTCGEARALGPEWVRRSFMPAKPEHVAGT
jgi:hypothetical protein